MAYPPHGQLGTMTYHLISWHFHGVLLGGLKQDVRKCIWYYTIFAAQGQRNLYLWAYTYINIYTSKYIYKINVPYHMSIKKLGKIHSRLWHQMRKWDEEKNHFK